MDEASRTNLDRHLEDLIKDMDVDAVVTNLKAHSLLTDEQVSTIRVRNDDSRT